MAGMGCCWLVCTDPDFHQDDSVWGWPVVG
jgi:hypothetical protein